MDLSEMLEIKEAKELKEQVQIYAKKYAKKQELQEYKSPNLKD